VGRRRVWGAIATGMVALSLLPVGGIAGQTTGGTVTSEKSGWWSQSNQGADTPNGALTPPLPRSPVVPENSLPVTAFLGQIENMSAIGFAVPEGMQATNLLMTLPLAEGGGADSGGAQAKIAACAITSYWEGGDNGKWEAKPEWDCAKAKAAGKRSDDGSWTFDLTPIAALWADQFEDVARPDGGVALVPDDATGTFQVAFDKDKITLDATLTEMTSLSDDAFTADVSQETIPAGTPTYSIDTGSLPAPSANGARSPAAGNGGGGGAQGGVAAGKQHDVGNLTGNLPLGLLLLVPFALGLAVLAGQSTRRARTELVRRQGGVGRALAARTMRPVRRSHPEIP
jgi:hypothetical protein